MNQPLEVTRESLLAGVDAGVTARLRAKVIDLKQGRAIRKAAEVMLDSALGGQPATVESLAAAEASLQSLSLEKDVTRSMSRIILLEAMQSPEGALQQAAPEPEAEQVNYAAHGFVLLSHIRGSAGEKRQVLDHRRSYVQKALTLAQQDPENRRGEGWVTSLMGHEVILGDNLSGQKTQVLWIHPDSKAAYGEFCKDFRREHGYFSGGPAPHLIR